MSAHTNTLTKYISILPQLKTHILGVRAGSRVDQDSDHLRVLLPAGDVEGRVPGVGPGGVDLLVAVVEDEFLDEAVVACVHGQEEGDVATLKGEGRGGQ